MVGIKIHDPSSVTNMNPQINCGPDAVHFHLPENTRVDPGWLPGLQENNDRKCVLWVGKA